MQTKISGIMDRDYGRLSLFNKNLLKSIRIFNSSENGKNFRAVRLLVGLSKIIEVSE